ncbi:esterase/lipase family protein [Kitasatospora sp. NPDC054939]
MPDRQHLVMVVPGIGGSLLAEGGAPERPIWSAAVRDLGLLRRPEALSVDVNPRLVPVGLVPTRKAMPSWTPVHGYNGLLARLGSLRGAVLDDGTPGGRTTAATVVGFGYDFRLGVRDAAERFGAAVDERLAALWPDRGTHDKRLIIVAHSLGGLVVRYWLAQSDENWSRCRALLTLGTPHAGAPKALDVLANGLPVAGVHVLRKRVGPVLGTWQSMADLLPAYAAVRAVGPAVRNTDPAARNTDPAARAADPARAVQDDGPVWLWPDALPVPALAGAATCGRRLHQDIADGWRTIPRDGPQVLPA